jgi:hypothetical protein
METAGCGVFNGIRLLRFSASSSLAGSDIVTLVSREQRSVKLHLLLMPN